MTGNLPKWEKAVWLRETITTQNLPLQLIPAASQQSSKTLIFQRALASQLNATVTTVTTFQRMRKLEKLTKGDLRAHSFEIVTQQMYYYIRMRDTCRSRRCERVFKFYLIKLKILSIKFSPVLWPALAIHFLCTSFLDAMAFLLLFLNLLFLT